ncbi:VOC family protein [Roseovarius pelagicus]|uniref:VOC family protein n=1 Tax=Roseovarius pelagicus TaxID=2980108 RepID=A0ABY6DE63_9RHOB|nr:VOC family protein [Roseovarius pelagicus]UXX82100.1 VOC family protein [Roseovarius pelagicus]
MRFEQCGLILNTEHYISCVGFYRDILGLPVMLEKDTETERLTAFDLGGTYLMVEPGGQAVTQGRTSENGPVKLRFNTCHIAEDILHLRQHGVTVSHQHHKWGETAEFHDPDGNRCALRSHQSFGR